jgi:hypothetical protein
VDEAGVVATLAAILATGCALSVWWRLVDLVMFAWNW